MRKSRLLGWKPEHQTVQLWARQLISNPPAILPLPSLFGEQVLCDRGWLSVGVCTVHGTIGPDPHGWLPNTAFG